MVSRVHPGAVRCSARRRGAVAALAVAVLSVGCLKGPTDLVWGGPAMPGNPNPVGHLVASHHGIVSGVVRDGTGAPIAGAFVDISTDQSPPTHPARVLRIEGNETPTGADGTFRMRYLLGLMRLDPGTPFESNPDSIVVRARGARAYGVLIGVGLPAPRTIDKLADSVTVTIVLPP